MQCRYYQAYYTKSLSRFYKADRGFCTEMQAVAGKWEVCDRWQAAERPDEKQKKIVLRKLNEVLDEMAEIKQVLVEIDGETENDG